MRLTQILVLNFFFDLLVIFPASSLPQPDPTVTPGPSIIGEYVIKQRQNSEDIVTSTEKIPILNPSFDGLKSVGQYVGTLDGFETEHFSMEGTSTIWLNVSIEVFPEPTQSTVKAQGAAISAEDVSTQDEDSTVAEIMDVDIRDENNKIQVLLSRDFLERIRSNVTIRPECLDGSNSRGEDCQRVWVGMYREAVNRSLEVRGLSYFPDGDGVLGYEKLSALLGGTTGEFAMDDDWGLEKHPYNLEFDRYGDPSLDRDELTDILNQIDPNDLILSESPRGGKKCAVKDLPEWEYPECETYECGGIAPFYRCLGGSWEACPCFPGAKAFVGQGSPPKADWDLIFDSFEELGKLGDVAKPKTYPVLCSEGKDSTTESQVVAEYIEDFCRVQYDQTLRLDDDQFRSAEFYEATLRIDTEPDCKELRLEPYHIGGNCETQFKEILKSCATGDETTSYETTKGGYRTHECARYSIEPHGRCTILVDQEPSNVPHGALADYKVSTKLWDRQGNEIGSFDATDEHRDRPFNIEMKSSKFHIRVTVNAREPLPPNLPDEITAGNNIFTIDSNFRSWDWPAQLDHRGLAWCQTESVVLVDSRDHTFKFKCYYGCNENGFAIAENVAYGF